MIAKRSDTGRNTAHVHCGLRRINRPANELLSGGPIFRRLSSRGRVYMIQLPVGRISGPPRYRNHAAALCIGLVAALALAPAGSAQAPPAASAPVPAPTGTALPQQSFAPLVKRVLPAVVNISVTEKNSAGELADEFPQRFR